MNPYAQRRARVLAKMREQGGGVAIIPTAPEVMRNADADYPYRHDSYFYYLTGFTEPEATLVLIAGATDQAILFCREKNEEREIWDGYRYGPAAAKETFGFDAGLVLCARQQPEARCTDTSMAEFGSCTSASWYYCAE
jgi:Xaa-Pro aminopeptidase